MKKFYVAGASKEMEERAKPVMAALRQMGHIITRDWTKVIDKYGPNNEKGILTTEQLADHAWEDLMGVWNAQALLLLAPQNPSTGAWVEFGAAVTLDIPVLVAGDCSKCIFCLVPNVHKFDTDAALLHFVEHKIDTLLLLPSL